MKKALLPVVLIAAFVLQSFEYSAPLPAVQEPLSLGEVVYAVPLRKQIPVENCQQEWFHEYIDGLANDSLFAPLFQKVRDKTLSVYLPDYPFNVKMNADSAIAKIDVPFITQVEEPYTGELLEISVLETKYPSSIVAVVFHEEWIYDASTLSLRKIVKGIVPIMEYGWSYTEDTYGPIIKPLFYIPFSGNSVEQNDFRLNEFTHALSGDSVRLLDYSSYDRYVSRSMTKSPDCRKVTQGMIASLKQQAVVKTSTLYKGNYPFNLPVGKKEKAGVVAAIDTAQHLVFHESWSVDFNTMTFNKEVHGAIFISEYVVTEVTEMISVTTSMKRPEAYLPMNGYRPRSLAMVQPVRVENFSSGVAYQNMPMVICPQMVTQDSLKFAGTAEAISMKARAGVFPIYDKHAHWMFDDPLDKRRVALSAVEIDNLFYRRDSVFVEDYYEGHVEVRTTEQNPADYAGFMFFESWFFDPGKLIFTKRIKSVGLLRYVVTDYGEVRGVQSMFVYDNATDSLMQPQYLLAKNVLSPVLINRNEQYFNENESGGHIINYGANYEEYITNENRYLMVQQVINAVLAGKMMAWTPTKPLRPFTVPQFKTMLDTVAKRNSASPPEGREYYVFNELTFDEDWYHNPATGQFYKHVNAITFGHRPYQSVDPETGEIKPDPMYFTIKVNGTK